MWLLLTGTDPDCAEPFDGDELATFFSGCLDVSGGGPDPLYAHSPFCSAPLAATDMIPCGHCSNSPTSSLLKAAAFDPAVGEKPYGSAFAGLYKLCAKQQQVTANANTVCQKSPL